MNVLEQTTATKMPFVPTHMTVTLVRAVKVNNCVLDSLAIVPLADPRFGRGRAEILSELLPA